jgi:L-fucose mutarotase
MLKGIDPLLSPELPLVLDEAVEQPVAYMQVGDTEAPYRSGLQRELIAELAQWGCLRPGQCQATERFAFYERARGAFAIVHTGELQPWGNFLFKKGVICAPLAP